jgi:hypothetical protein
MQMRELTRLQMLDQTVVVELVPVLQQMLEQDPVQVQVRAQALPQVQMSELILIVVVVQLVLLLTMDQVMVLDIGIKAIDRYICSLILINTLFV